MARKRRKLEKLEKLAALTPRMLEIPNKIGYVNLQGGRQRVQRAQRRRFQTTFKLANIRPVQVASISKLFLRYTQHVPLGLQPHSK
jgi:hypothetical protein